MRHNRQNQNKKAIKIALGIFLFSFIFFLLKTNFFYIKAQNDNAPRNLSQEIQNRGIAPITNIPNTDTAQKLDESNPIFDFFKNIQQKIEKQFQKPTEETTPKDQISETTNNTESTPKDINQEIKELLQNHYSDLEDKEDTIESKENIESETKKDTNTEIIQNPQSTNENTTHKNIPEVIFHKLTNYISQKYFGNTEAEKICTTENNVIILETGGHNLLPEYLSGNTFYILYGENYSFDYMLKITDNCTKILGKSGFTKLYTTNHEGATIKIISGTNNIIEHMILEGEEGVFGSNHESNNYGIYLASTGNFINNTQSYNQQRFAIYMENQDNFVEQNQFFKESSDIELSNETPGGKGGKFSKTNTQSKNNTSHTDKKTKDKTKKLKEYSAINKPTKIKKDTQELESELIWNLFEKIEDKFIGKNSIDLSENEGKIPISIVLESVDESIKVEIPEGTIFKTNDGLNYTGTILAPQKTNKIGFKSSGSKIQSSISFKVGSPDQEVLLQNDQNGEILAQIEMEIEGYNIGDFVPFYSSSDGEKRELLGSFEVIEKDGKSIVNLETPHFSYISAGNGYGNFFNGPIIVSEDFQTNQTVYCQASINRSNRIDAEISYTNNGGLDSTVHCSIGNLPMECFYIQFSIGNQQTDTFVFGPVDWYCIDTTPPNNLGFSYQNFNNFHSGDIHLIITAIDGQTYGSEKVQACISQSAPSNDCILSNRTPSGEDIIFTDIEDGKYRIFGRAMDGLGNVSDRIEGKSRTQDSSAPTGGGFTINGGAQTTKNRFLILNFTCPYDQREPIELAYGDSPNPTNWAPCANYNRTLNVIPGRGYRNVYVRFRDSGGNTTQDISKSIFLTETPPPTPNMATEPPYTSGTSNTVYSSLVDGPGDFIEYQFCANTTNNTINCSTQGWSSANYATFSNLDEQIYYYFVRAKDLFGYIPDDWSESTYSTQDNTAPTGGDFSINGFIHNETLYTSGTNLTLDISCPSDTGVGGVQVAYGDSVDPDNRQNCTSSKTLEITQPDGVIPIYMRFRDALENTTSNIIESITLDTTGPSTPNIIQPNSGALMDTGNVLLEWAKSIDSGIGSDKYNYIISTNSEFSNIILSGFIQDTGATVLLEPGTYYRKVRAIDLLGNHGDRSQTNNFKHVFDNEGPSKANIIIPTENQQLFIGNNQIQRNESIDGQSGLSGYILQISTDNFISIKKSIFTIYNDYIENFETTGNYQLRIISIDKASNTTTGDTISINIQDNIIEYYFGSGSIFTKNRAANNCNVNDISIIYVYNYSGYGLFPYTNLNPNKIYILQEGIHIADKTIKFNGDCIALVGENPFEKKQKTEIYSNIQLTDSIENFQNNNIIIDNIYLNGTSKGIGGQHNNNSNGINFNQSISNAIHNTTIVGFGIYAINYNGNSYGNIYNIDINNNAYALNIQTSKNNYLESINIINNTNGLTLTTFSNNNLINNAKIINNSNGIAVTDSHYNTISNSLIGKNNFGFISNYGLTNIFNSSIVQNNQGLVTNLNGNIISFNTNIIENFQKDISIYPRSSTFTYYGYLRTNIIENNILSPGGTNFSSIGYTPGYILYEKEQSFNNRFNIKNHSGIWDHDRNSFTYGYKQNGITLDGIYSLGYNIQTKKKPVTYTGTQLTLTTLNILDSIESEFIASKTKKIQLNTSIEPVITTGATQRLLTIIGNNSYFTITGDILAETGGFLTNSIQTTLNLINNKNKNRIISQVQTDNSNGFTHQESIAIIDTTAPTRPDNIFIKEITITTGVKIERTPSIDSGAGVSGYTYELSNFSNFSNIIKSGSEITHTTLIEGLEENTEYFFRVKAVDNVQHESDRSNVFSFTIAEEIENLVVDYYFGENNDFTNHRTEKCNLSNMQTVKVPNYNNLGNSTFPYSKLAGNTIYLLEKGPHILSELIEFDGECIVLAGEGSKQGEFDKVQLHTNNTLTDMIKSTKSRIIVDNLIINGNDNGIGSTHSPNGNGISFAGSKNATISNIKTSNFSINHITISYSSNIKIDNVYNNKSPLYGITLQNSNNNILENINMFNVYYYGIQLLSSSYNTLNNINLFNNNDSISNGIHGILLSLSSFNTINNSNIQNNGSFGIWIDGNKNIINNSTVNNNEQYGIVITGQNNVLNDIYAINNVGADILIRGKDTKVYGNIITKKTNKKDFIIGGNELEPIGFSEGDITILANNTKSWDLQQNILSLETNKYLSTWTTMNRGKDASRIVPGDIEFSIGQLMPTQVPIAYYSGNELIADNIGEKSKFYPNNFIASKTKKLDVSINIDKEYSSSSDKNRKISIQCSDPTIYYITGDIVQGFYGECSDQKIVDLILNGNSEGERSIIVQTRTDPKQKNHKHIYTYLDDSAPNAPLIGNIAWISTDKKEIEFFWNKSYDKSKIIGYNYGISQYSDFSVISHSGFTEYNTLNITDNNPINSIYIRVKSIDISGKESEWLNFGDNIDNIIYENNITINKYLSPQNYYTSQWSNYSCTDTGNTKIYILKSHPIESGYIFDFDHLQENSIYILESENYIIDESISFDKKCIVLAGNQNNKTQILSNKKMPTMISIISTTNNIIENLQINGEHTSTGSTHAKSKAGLYLLQANINSIYDIETFGFQTYGLFFYAASTRNILNYITSYKNYYGISLYGGSRDNAINNNAINNLITFNNTEGLHSAVGSFNTFNNILNINNNIGMGFSASSDKNVIYNSILANNKNYGIDSSVTTNYDILSNIKLSNNGIMDIKTNNNKWNYYNYIAGNTIANSVVIGGNEFSNLGWIPGHKTNINPTEIISLSANILGDRYLWPRSNIVQGQNSVWKKTNNNLNISFGNNITKQTQPVMRSGNELIYYGKEGEIRNSEYFIGSKTKKTEINTSIDKFITEGSDLDRTIDLFLSGNGELNYMISGEILQTISGSFSGNKSIPITISTTTDGLKNIIIQVWSGNENPTHYQTTTFVDSAPPTTPLPIQPSQHHTGHGDSIFANIDFERSECMDYGIGMSGYVLEISDQSDFSNIIYKHTGYDTTQTVKLKAGSYFWRVTAFDKALKYSPYSAVRPFYVETNYVHESTPPSTPTILYPVNNTIFSGSEIDIYWSPSIDTGIGLSGYIYEISKDSLFQDMAFSGNTENTGIHISNLTDSKYFIRLFAIDYLENISPASEYIKFIIDNTPPQITFIGNTPSHNSTISSNGADIQAEITEEKLESLSRNRNGLQSSLYDSGLIFMMNFDNISALEEDDSTVKDLSIYGNHGTVSGAIWTENGKHGGAYEFGKGNTIYIDNNIIGTTDGLTISARVKSPASSGGIVVKGDQGTWQRNEYGIRYAGDPNRLIFFICNEHDFGHELAKIDQLSFNIPLNERIHILATTSQELGKLQVYINGKLKGEKIRTVENIGANKKRKLYIGKSAETASWLGLIDEVRIYNRALSSGEIEQLYKTNLNKVSDNQWNFTSTQTCLPDGSYFYSLNAKDGYNDTTAFRNFGIQLPSPTLGIPAQAIKIDNIVASTQKQSRELIFSGIENTFRVNDSRGFKSRYTTISLSGDLSNDSNTHHIGKENVFFKAQPNILTLDGIQSNDIKLSPLINNTYKAMTGTITYITKDPNSNRNSCMVGTYANNPSIKIDIPAYQKADTYHGTMIFTLYD